MTSAGQITAGGAGNVTVTGFGGNPTGTGGANRGLAVSQPNTRITSSGGDVVVNGTGGGGGISPDNHGMFLTTGAQITAGGSGTVTINCQGGNLGGTGANNHGLLLSTAGTAITSSGGNISVTGTAGGGAGSSDNRGVDMQTSAAIAGTGNASVTLGGTGGAGGNSQGVKISGSAAVTAVNGSISITATDGATPSQAFALSNATSLGAKVQTTGTGTIAVTADSMAVSTSDVTVDAGANTVTLKQKTLGKFINLGSTVDTTPNTLELSDGELDQVTAGMLVIGDANSGGITQSAAITRTAATNVTLNSGSSIAINTGPLDTAGGNLVLNPGGASNNFGPLTVGTDVSTGTGPTPGTLSFGGGDRLAVAITGPTPDSQFTQLKVVGKVDLTGAALALAGGYAPGATDTFTIIDNDGTDPVTGTFAGLAEGATLTFNSVTLVITYHGGDGNDVVLTSNRPPVASPFTITRYPTQPVKVSKTQVISLGSVSDPDVGDTVSVQSVGTPANGTAVISGNFVFYTPNTGFTGADSFTYTVADNRGSTATSTISVAIVTDNATTNNIAKFTKTPGGPAELDFNGIPNLTYGIQYSATLTPSPTWVTIGSVTMSNVGTAHYSDTDPGRMAAPQGYYRFIYPAP